MPSPEIEQIKAKIDVAELLGEYLKLVPAGAGAYKALCPFHNEKTPSLMVSPARGSWHCFGCGAGGDVFEFLMKMENIDFPEALRILAQKAGVTLSRHRPEVASRKNNLYDVCELATRYWQKVLQESPRAQVARDYLAGRGVSEEAQEDFKIGYAIDDWSNLFDFLRKKGFAEQEIFSAGFTVRKDRGSGYYDRFRNRVMFPIIDHNGRVCGFTGRTLSKDEPAKYVNTPQTDIYNKSAIVFALYQAKNEIRKQDYAVVVEGQMDAVSCHQYGFKNTVASSGTALTKEQLQLLKRYTNNIYFALDADSAGQKATGRGEELIRDMEKEDRVINSFDRFGRLSQFIDPALNYNSKVITIPYGKDPDECLKSNPADWAEAIKEAQSAMEYFWQSVIKNKDLNDLAVKKHIASFLGEKIAKIDDPVENGYWTHEIGSRLNIREDDFRDRVSQIKAAQKAPSKAIVRPQDAARQTAPQNTTNDRDLLIFMRVLALIWMFPDFLAKLGDYLDPEVWIDPVAEDLYKKIILFYTVNNELFSISAAQREEQTIFDLFYDWVKTQAVSESALKTLEQSYLLAQKDFASLDAKEAKNELDTLIRLLKSNYLNVMISRLKLKLDEAEKTGDAASAENVYLELSELIKRKSAV
ncbi:MAG: DNA primase [Patescibacteria group bacterium]